MAGRSKKQEQVNHPYVSFEGSVVWKAIDKALVNLVRNGDLDETTPRRYITGYLTKSVIAAIGTRRGPSPHKVR